MKDLLTAIFGSSPRTTVLGIMGALAAVLPQYVENGKVNWQNLAIGGLSIVFGRLVKDSDGVNGKKGKKIAKEILPGDISKP